MRPPEWICGSGPASSGSNANGAEQTVVLADGSRIVCDEIIAGVGAIPEALGAGCGTCDRERHQRPTTDCAPAIPISSRPATAAPSRIHSIMTGAIRLEAWRNAQDQGALAARNMLGADQAYDTVPWFWSDQYDQTLQIAGLPDEGMNSVKRDLGDGAELHFHLGEDGRLVAASGVGAIRKVAKKSGWPKC